MLKPGPIRPIHELGLSKDLRSAGERGVSPLAVEVEPVDWRVAVGVVVRRERLRRGVVGVCVCAECRIPEDALVGVIDYKAFGEVEVGDCVVVVAGMSA